MLNNRQYCTFVAVIMIEKVIEYVEKYIIRLKLYWFMNFDRAVLMSTVRSKYRWQSATR